MSESDTSIEATNTRKRGRPRGSTKDAKKQKMTEGAEILAGIQQLNSAIQDVKSELSTIRTFMESTNKRLDTLEKQQHVNVNNVAEVRKKCNKLEKDIEGAIDEMEQRKRCATNLIIHGLAESSGDAQEDINTVIELLQKFHQTAAVKRVFRVGQKSSFNRPTKVIFSSEADSKTVLDAYKSIPVEERKTKFEKIYIDRDLTKKQQQEKKAALLELKTRSAEGEKLQLREVNGHFRCVNNVAK